MFRNSRSIRWRTLTSESSLAVSMNQRALRCLTYAFRAKGPILPAIENIDMNVNFDGG